MSLQPFSLAVIIFLFASCASRNDSYNLHGVSASFENANKVLLQNNDYLYYKLENKLRDVRTAATAGMWMPKADTLRRQSSDVLTWIENLKKEMHKQYTQNPDNKDQIVQNVFLKEGKAHELFVQLSDYKRGIIDLMGSNGFADNPVYREQLQKDSASFWKIIPVLANKNSQPIKEQSWLDSTFNNAGSSMCEVILNSVANNVLVSENLLIDYFDKHSSVICGLNYDQFSIITSLSSSYIKSGDAIEVTSGIGSISVAARPTIFIDGERMKLKPEGVAVYTFRPNKKPGKYTVPVRIVYTRPDGTTETVEKNCSYTIAQ
jgi:hypothetical protein